MSFKVVTIFLILVSFFASPLQALTLVGKLKANESFTLFYFGDRSCRFVNKGQNDTTIIKHISLDTVTEFRYGFSFASNGKSTYFRHTFLAKPSDSLVFAKKGKDLISLNSGSSHVFIDQYIEAGFYALPVIHVEKIFSPIEFGAYYQQLQKNFSRDSIKIDSLFLQGILNTDEKQMWLNFRRITFLVAVFKLYKNEDSFQPEMAVKEKLYQEGMTYLRTHSLDGVLMKKLLYDLCQHWKKKHHTTDWLNFYLTNLAVIHKAYVRNGFVNHILNATNKNSNQYDLNIKRIKEYAVLRDPGLLEICDKFRYFDFAKLDLRDKSNQPINFSEIAMRSGKEYFLIDVWASWCKPCREQLPDFIKYRDELIERNICFISISTDSKHEDWTKALREEDQYGQLYQFRLVNSRDTYFSKFFDIQTIPRYLILNKWGKVISNRFDLPNDEHFKSKLIKILETN